METLTTMLKAATTATRAPRGTKPVSQAFLTALDSIPEMSRAAVAKAALTMIRDEMKSRKEKLKVATAKEKEKARTAPPVPPTPAKATSKAAPAKSTAKMSTAKTAAAKSGPTKRGPKAAAATAPVANGLAASKRRGRKPAVEVASDEEE